MGLFNKEVELIPPKKQNKPIKVKTLSGYSAIREQQMAVVHLVLNLQ